MQSAVPRRLARAALLAVILPALSLPLPPKSALADEPVRAARARPGAAPADILAPPDIFGPGAVLRIGRLHTKVTNAGLLGNPFTNISPDPSGQWPNDSNVEYLNFIGLAVGAKDPAPPPGARARRVSYLREWSPPTADGQDRMYRTNEGAFGGKPLVDDDDDGTTDEDFLDGRDNDGDGAIDEDFGALGYETYTCVMRDDGAYTVPNGGEPCFPLGLEVRQMAWSYLIPGLEDFVAVRYSIFNRSGHALDSVYVGFAVDFDAGPPAIPGYYLDDRDLPGYPSGEFVRVVDPSELQFQLPHAPIPGVSPDSALCPRAPLRVNGFSVADDDNDAGITPGVASFLLLDHTIDGLGLNAPNRVGFRAFRSFTGGTPWDMGGSPTSDSLRYTFLSGTENVDPVTGFVNAPPGAGTGDYVAWCSVGPFLAVPNGGEVQVTIAFALSPGTAAHGLQYAADYAAWKSGSLDWATLAAAHAPLLNALAIQQTHDGVYEFASGEVQVADFHGRETPVIAPPGEVIGLQDCRDIAQRFVTDQEYSWFDFDCDWCSGVWDQPTQSGTRLHRWKVDTGLLGVTPAPGRLGPGSITELAVSPNPSREKGRIGFTLARPGDVRVTVHDLAGRQVRLIDSGAKGAGRHEVAWDGLDDRGRPASPGLYLLRVRSGKDEASARMVRLR